MGRGVYVEYKIFLSFYEKILAHHRLIGKPSLQLTFEQWMSSFCRILQSFSLPEGLLQASKRLLGKLLQVPF